ncbi:MAG TPA: phosphate ABC transporter permease subunit PstC [Acidobacteriota bacterium]|jgi:phosphate transport system permease protein
MRSLTRETLIEYLFAATALLAVGILAGIFLLLFTEGIPVFRYVRAGQFFSWNWNPNAYDQPDYGILSQVLSTLLVTGGALAFSIPIGIGAAAYLSEIAAPRTREFIKPMVELLAGVPSVVIGFLGIVVTGPWLARSLGTSNGLNALNGSLLLGLMSLPTIVTITEDALRAVPTEFKAASLALGANRLQTLVRVTIPSAATGVIAACMLGMGRAVGETMTVLMATGNALAPPQGFLDSVRTMTATIAIELGEVPFGTAHYHALFVIGFVLFIFTFLVNSISDLILLRFQRKMHG